MNTKKISAMNRLLWSLESVLHTLAIFLLKIMFGTDAMQSCSKYIHMYSKILAFQQKNKVSS